MVPTLETITAHHRRIHKPARQAPLLLSVASLQEAECIQTATQRGIAVVASAQACDFQALVNSPSLCGLLGLPPPGQGLAGAGVGGASGVGGPGAGGRAKAAGRAAPQGLALAPPVVSAVAEVVSSDGSKVRLYRSSLAQAAERVRLQGVPPRGKQAPQLRRRLPGGRVCVERV